MFKINLSNNGYQNMIKKLCVKYQLPANTYLRPLLKDVNLTSRSTIGS